MPDDPYAEFQQPAPIHPLVSAIATGEGFNVPGSRPARNNSPGDIMYGDFAKLHGATGADDKGFAIFPDKPTGYQATQALLQSSGYSNLPMEAALRKWVAPKNADEEAKFQNYKAGVYKATGFKPTDTVAQVLGTGGGSQGSTDPYAEFQTPVSHEAAPVGIQRPVPKALQGPTDKQIMAEVPSSPYALSDYPNNNPAVNDIVEGGKQLYQGAATGNGSTAAGGAHKIVRGGGSIAAQSLLPMAAVSAPVATALGLGVGGAVGYGTTAAGKGLGFDPNYSDLAGDATGIIAGGLASKLPGLAQAANSNPQVKAAVSAALKTALSAKTGMAGMAAYLASVGQHYGIPGMGVAEVLSALYGLGDVVRSGVEAYKNGVPPPPGTTRFTKPPMSASQKSPVGFPPGSYSGTSGVVEPPPTAATAPTTSEPPQAAPTPQSSSPAGSGRPIGTPPPQPNLSVLPAGTATPEPPVPPRVKPLSPPPGSKPSSFSSVGSHKIDAANKLEALTRFANDQGPQAAAQLRAMIEANDLKGINQYVQDAYDFAKAKGLPVKGRYGNYPSMQKAMETGIDPDTGQPTKSTFAQLLDRLK